MCAALEIGSHKGNKEMLVTKKNIKSQVLKNIRTGFLDEHCFRERVLPRVLCALDRTGTGSSLFLSIYLF